jgi:hypothetical protein
LYKEAIAIPMCPFPCPSSFPNLSHHTQVMTWGTSGEPYSPFRKKTTTLRKTPMEQNKMGIKPTREFINMNPRSPEEMRYFSLPQ